MNYFIVILCISVTMLLSVSLLGQTDDMRVDRELKRDVIDRVSRLLASNYVDSVKGNEAGKYLQQRFVQSVYQSYDHPRAFAKAMTEDLQKLLNDRHVRLRPLSLSEQQSRAEDPLFTLLYDAYIKYAANYGVREIKILPDNVGYLALDSFEPLSQVRYKLMDAMSYLEDVSALIIDLRENNGGNPETVQFLCSYFFDTPTHLNSQYWRRGNYIEEFWTLDNIGAKKQSTISLFILTSQRTFSAAEECAYDLKVQKRATIVGEKTAGGANPGYSFTIGNRFSIFIPTGRPINPLTGTNWEGIGVEPDIKISAERALDAAVSKASIEAKRFSETEDKIAIREFLDLSRFLNEADANHSDSIQTMISPVLNHALNQNLIDESSINSIGYYFLKKRRTTIALVIFQFNVMTYPNSANVYDSLGEAYFKKGDSERAIINYRKSLEINPQNQNAQYMLKILTRRDN